MTDIPARPPRAIWVGFILFFALLALAFCLWFFQAMRQAGQPQLGVLGPVVDFSLTNQDNRDVSLADLTNQVWVADIIFTRWAGPCPRMTAQMKSLQEALPKNSGAKLVTLTTDPEFDTPEVLKRYGQRFGADFNRWTFLTGTKEGIAGLAAGSLKLGSTPVAPTDQKNAADLFIHTTIFVLVDKHARLRGIFETGGEDVNWENSVRPKLFADIRRLEREP